MENEVRTAAATEGEATSATDTSLGDRDVAPELAAVEVTGGDRGAILSQMLALVNLDQEQLESIVQTVPGGGTNVQEIYPLSPLQEGMLFHHLLNERSDTYVLSTLFEMNSQRQTGTLINALEKVIDRHDVLRSAVIWKGLPRPVQVVYRRATLSVEKFTLDPSRDSIEQLREVMRPGLRRIDLRHAPLLRLLIAADPRSTHWYGVLQVHHLVCDHQSLRNVIEEALVCAAGHAQELPPPAQFRSYVASALAIARGIEDEEFFRRKLGEVDEPTAPFGLHEVHGIDADIDEAREQLNPELAGQIRIQAQRYGVSAARLFHVAWGLVTAHTSARDDVVFGTVVLAGIQRGTRSQRMLGMSVNTLPLRLKIVGLTCQELVVHAHRELGELLNHESTPLTLAQACSGVKGTAALFTSLLNCRRSTGTGLEGLNETGIRVLERRDAWTNYPITMTVDDLGTGFVLTAHTDRRIDPQRTVSYLRTAIEGLVEALEQAPQTPALALSVVPEIERREVIEEFNATKAAYRGDKLIHEVFEEQVRRTPKATAVMCDGASITYAELNDKANQVAHYLRGEWIGGEQLIGACFERCLEMVVGLLGILKAGGAYVPLDPHYPAERLRHMVEDACPQIVLAHKKVQSMLPATSANVVLLDAMSRGLMEQSVENLATAELNLSPQDLVYVIYTSGSTGRPKGTAMSHRSMVNLIEWHRQNLPLREGQRVLQFAALSFDVAFQEMFSTLCTGGTLVLLDEWVRRDARALMEFLSEQAIERLFVPPLMLQSMAEYFKTAEAAAPGHLKDVITAGEQLRISPEISNYFKHLPGCRLHNHYGPTETHVVTALTLSGDPGEWPVLPEIGRPISNIQIYVLDKQRQPVPLGVAGEIYIGGVGVARGYRNQPELTEERFVADPFSADAHARLYKTGDLGRWSSQGGLEYLGRNDDQVKIRGFRIELGEIESQLARHEQVKEAAVIAREDMPGEKRLVAYVTSRDESDLSAGELRDHLQTVLPDYMVPAAFVTLEHLPVTPNGKLDRRALPAPDLNAYVSRQYEPPHGEVEEVLAGIWQDLLRVERVGRQDNFFSLGGHSLHMMQLVSKIAERLAVRLDVAFLFKTPDLQQLARAVDEARFSKQHFAAGAQMDEGEVIII